MTKKLLLPVIIAAITLISLPDGTKPTDGIDGTNGTNASILGKSFYLEDKANGDIYYEDETVYLSSSVSNTPPHSIVQGSKNSK